MEANELLVFARVAGLEQLSLSIDATPNDELRALLDLIADSSWNSAHRTAHQIKNKGIDAIPGLLEAFKSEGFPAPYRLQRFFMQLRPA